MLPQYRKISQPCRLYCKASLCTQTDDQPSRFPNKQHSVVLIIREPLSLAERIEARLTRPTADTAHGQNQRGTHHSPFHNSPCITPEPYSTSARLRAKDRYRAHSHTEIQLRAQSNQEKKARLADANVIRPTKVRQGLLSISVAAMARSAMHRTAMPRTAIMEKENERKETENEQVKPRSVVQCSPAVMPHFWKVRHHHHHRVQTNPTPPSASLSLPDFLR